MLATETYRIYQDANQELKSGMKNQQLAGVKDAMPQTLIPLTLCFQHGLFSTPDSHS